MFIHLQLQKYQEAEKYLQLLSIFNNNNLIFFYTILFF